MFSCFLTIISTVSTVFFDSFDGFDSFSTVSTVFSTVFDDFDGFSTIISRDFLGDYPGENPGHSPGRIPKRRTPPPFDSMAEWAQPGPYKHIRNSTRARQASRRVHGQYTPPGRSYGHDAVYCVRQAPRPRGLLRAPHLQAGIAAVLCVRLLQCQK